MINHYKTLNISENSTELEIKKAFRKLAKQLHPDKTKSQNSNEFLLIKNSYDILIDRDKRKVFDKQLYFYRNPRQDFTEVDLGKLNEKTYINESIFSKILGIVIRLSIATIIIIVFTYSCDFINGNGKTDNNETSNSFESDLISDSLKNEDYKIEEKLKNIKEEKQTNGELKF